jgi:hypothetical protein
MTSGVSGDGDPAEPVSGASHTAQPNGKSREVVDPGDKPETKQLTDTAITMEEGEAEGEAEVGKQGNNDGGEVPEWPNDSNDLVGYDDGDMEVETEVQESQEQLTSTDTIRHEQPIDTQTETVKVKEATGARAVKASGTATHATSTEDGTGSTGTSTGHAATTALTTTASADSNATAVRLVQCTGQPTSRPELDTQFLPKNSWISRRKKQISS